MEIPSLYDTCRIEEGVVCKGLEFFQVPRGHRFVGDIDKTYAQTNLQVGGTLTGVEALTITGIKLNLSREAVGDEVDGFMTASGALYINERPCPGILPLYMFIHGVKMGNLSIDSMENFSLRLHWDKPFVLTEGQGHLDVIANIYGAFKAQQM